MTEIRIPDFLIAGADADDGGPDGGDTLLGRVRPHTELGRYASLAARDSRPRWKPEGTPPIVPPREDDLDRELETHRRLKRLFDESTAAMAALDRQAAELERGHEPSQSERRFRAEAKRVRDRHGRALDAQTRPLFERDFDAALEPAALGVRHRARAREANGFKASLDNFLVGQRERDLAASNALVEDEALRQALHHIGVASRLGWLADEGAARTQFLDAYGQERARRMAASGAETEDASPILGSVPTEDSIVGDVPATEDAAMTVDPTNPGATKDADPTAALTGQPGGPTGVIPEHGAAREAETDHDSVAGDPGDDRIPGDGTDSRALEQLAAVPESSRLLPRNDPPRPAGPSQPERSMERLTPLLEAPPVPNYRAGVGPVTKEWQAYHEAVYKRFPNDPNMRQLAMEIFAAEGGRLRDRRSGAVGGMLPGTLVRLKKIFRDDSEVSKLPDDPSQLTLDQLTVATKAYFDDALTTAGGSDALFRLEPSNLPLAIADVVLREGSEERAVIFGKAIKAIQGTLPPDEANRVKDAFNGKPGKKGEPGESLIRRTMAASTILVELKKGAQLSNAIANARNDVRPDETERHDRFRPK